MSLPPGPKIKYRVSHFHEGLALVLVLGEILTKKKSLFSVNSVLHYLGSSCRAQNLRNFGCFSQCWPKNVTHSQKFSSDLAPHKSSNAGSNLHLTPTEISKMFYMKSPLICTEILVLAVSDPADVDLQLLQVFCLPVGAHLNKCF